MNFDNIYNGILENFNVPELFLDDILTTLELRQILLSRLLKTLLLKQKYTTLAA